MTLEDEVRTYWIVSTQSRIGDKKVAKTNLEKIRELANNPKVITRVVSRLKSMEAA